MSETSEQQVTTGETGRCEKAAHELTHSSWNQQFNESVLQMTIASTIDRLAADVATIKAKVDAISPEDVAHLVECEKAWVRLVEEKETAAIRERDEARAEFERLKNELYDREQELLSLRADTVERYTPPAAPQPAAPPAGWLTTEERGHLWFTLDLLRRLGYSPAAEAVEAILARAGSPPVVEVPVMVFGSEMHKRYRVALYKAGIPWKEVGLE